MRSAAIWINDFVVVILVFGNIIYKMHGRNFSHRSSQPYVSQGIQDYAQKAKHSNNPQLDTEDFSTNTNITRVNRKSQRMSSAFLIHEEDRKVNQQDSFSRLELGAVATEVTKEGVCDVASAQAIHGGEHCI